MIDFWELAKDFKSGDSVQKFMPGDPGQLSPFIGRVIASHPGLGAVDVQWPTGVERITPDELVKVNPELQRYLPPTLDQSYTSYDNPRDRQKTASTQWRTVELPAGFHRDLAVLWGRGASDLVAYDSLWSKYASFSEDSVIRDEVEKFYLVAKNLAGMRLQQHALKTAAYWVAQNRQYRVTSDELTGRKPACPKCGTGMRKTTYKMDKGARVRLWGCPRDMFLIKQTDMLGPGGEPVEW